ncbi:MAG TPA: hypothetical protein VKL40_06460 [Candidatus Angelobacter sp.]|nr:hypothetical protein [Candidatus Angelobacter sp.]
MRNTGVGLVVAANLLLLYMSLGSVTYARSHAHLDASLLAQYAGPWPVVLACALAATAIMLALIPIRRGERWALWTSLATLLALLAVRLTTDPRCLVVLDPHQHGCHTFMIAMVVGVAGLALAGFSRQKA